MSGPIKREEVFNKNVFIDPAKEAKTLNDALNVVELSLKDIAKLSMKAFKGIDPKNAEDIKKLSKALQKNKDDVKNLTDFEKEREKQLKKLKKLNSDRIGQLDELQLLSKKQAAANKDNAIINSKLSGTLEKLAASSRKLRREREGLDLTTEKNRKRLIAINKELDKNNKIILKNSDALKKQKINVGNYSESIQDAASASGLFGKILGPLAAIQGTLTALTKKDTVAKEVNTAATASMSVKQKALALTTGGLTKATKLFNFVLKKSPIFLAAAAIGALISFFTRSQKGIDAVSTSLAGLTAGFDVVLDRFQIVGEGIVQVVKGFASFDPDEISAGLDKIANAFKGITKEIKEETVIASKLKGLLIALTREQKLFEAQQSASLTRAKELNLISKDKLRTDQERIKALKEANKIEVDIAEKQLELQEKELAGAFESISADQQSLELTKAQIEFVDDLKNGRLDIATAAEKARDFTLGQSKAEEALFEIIDKIVAQEQAKQSLLDKQATTIKKLSALQVQVATKNAMALVREAQAKRQISKDDELAIQKRVDLLTEAAALEIESFRIQASANIKNEQEVAAAKLQINAKLQADIKKLLGGGQDFEAIARKQVKVVNDIEQEILQNDIDRLNRRLETEKLTEKERLRILDEIFETRKTKQQAFSEFLLTNEKLTAEERELINIKLGKSLEDIENDRVDAAKEANEEILKDEEAFADKTISLANKVTTEVLKELSKADSARLESLDTQISNQVNLINTLRQNAVEGTEKALAFEEARLEKQRLAKQREEERQAKRNEAIALAQTFLNQVAEQSKDNPDTAIAEAFKNTFLAKAIAKGLLGFYEGTDEVGSTGTETKFSSGRDGYVVKVDKGEKIFNSKQSDRLNKAGFGDRSDVVDLVEDYATGNTWDFMPRLQTFQTSNDIDLSKVVESNERVVRAIESIPPAPSYDLSGLNMWIETRFTAHGKEMYQVMLKHFKK